MNDNSYSYCFPDTSSHEESGHQFVFSNYGVAEAVNIAYDDECKRLNVISKQHQPPLFNTLVDNCEKKALCVCHPVLPLGVPKPLLNLIHTTNFEDIYKTSFAKNQYALDVEGQIINFAQDHPDAYHGTFLRLLAHYFPFDLTDQSRFHPHKRYREDFSRGQLPIKFLPRFRPVAANLQFPDIDPAMCDIPLPLLNELLSSELELESGKLTYDSAYSGSVLSCQHLPSRSELNCGLLVYPQTPAMDELMFQLISTSTKSDRKPNENCSMERGGAEDSKPIIGPRCKMKVGGCVFQTDCRLGVDEKQVLVGVRSDYRALLTSFDLNLIDFKRASTAADLRFGDGCLQHVGAVQSDARLSSLSVSRHIAGECVVATYDDRVYLWDAARQTSGGSALSSLQKVGVDLGGCGDDGPCANRMPMQVKFGAHPRQLFVATDRQVALVDVRTGSNSRARKLFTSPGSARERVNAMLAGVDFDQDSEFTCVVATDRNLQLFDLRHCKLPLLKWALNLRQPCRYLASTTCHQQRHEATSLLIAANSQQIHCHGFATTSSCRPRHPPVSLGPPRKLAATHHVHRALARLSPALRRAARKRLTQPMVGVAALTSGDAATVVVHVTAAGDLFYQTVALTTGDDATRQDAKGEESARAAYEEWARAAVAGEVEVVAGEISHPQSELLDAVTSSIRGAAVAAHCGACDDARCSPFDDESRGDASPADGDAPCAKCGLAVGAASNLQRCRHHSRPFVRDSLRRASSFWPDDDGDDDGDELQLIDMTRTEGLGHVLVATWTGAYEDVWAEMRVKEEEKKAELEQSLFDLRQQPPVADSPAPLIFCGEIAQSSVTSLPPNGGSSGHVIEPVRMTTTFTKAERASSPPAADWTEPKLERDVGERMTSFRHCPANVTSFHHSPAYMTSFHHSPTNMTSFHHSPTNMTSFHHSPAKKMKLVKNSLKREDEGKFPSPNGSRRKTATPTVRKRNNNVGF